MIPWVLWCNPKFFFLRSFCFGDHFEITQSFSLTTYNFQNRFEFLSVSKKTVKTNADQLIYESLKFLKESLDKLRLVLSQKHWEWNRSKQTQWLVLFELNTKMTFSTFSQVFYEKHWTGERTIFLNKTAFFGMKQNTISSSEMFIAFPHLYIFTMYIYISIF